MCRKRDLVSDQVNKYKACLNLHGIKQELGVNYFETYVPVTTWMAICLLLTVAILNHQFLRQVDFVMTYTQAPIECEMHMILPQGVLTWFGHAKDFVLHLINNIYEKQFGLVWYAFDCGKCVLVSYVDGIFMSPDKILIDKAIKDLIAVRLKIKAQG